MEAAARAATVEVWKLSHYYTAGHAYACLKIAEYCVTQQAAKCIGPQLRQELGLALGSEVFLDAAGRAIFHRCFPFYSTHAAVEALEDKYMSGNPRLVFELQEHGLWDMANNRLLSPLFQYHLFCLMPKINDFIFQERSQIGDALYYCLRDYKRWKFTQYEAGTEVVRDRCEDGTAFFIGCELSKYCLVSRQHAIPKRQPTPGRPPSVDYYLNGRLDMHLELVKNGNLLEEHFDRFLSGAYGLRKPFAVLDISFVTDKPRELSGKYAVYNSVFYTYVVQTRELYRGTELFTCGSGTSLSAPSERVRDAARVRAAAFFCLFVFYRFCLSVVITSHRSRRRKSERSQVLAMVLSSAS